MIGERYIHRIKHKLNTLRHQRNLRHFHTLHKKAAFEAIQKAEKGNGIKLSPVSMRQADAYAHEIFGSVDYAPWLYFYALIHGSFEEGWIPHNYYAQYVLPESGLTGVSMVKSFSRTVHNTKALPDIAYFIDGILYDRDYAVIGIKQLKKIASRTCNALSVKKNQSLRGQGVKK